MTDDYVDDDDDLPDEALARLDIYSEDMRAAELASFIGRPADDLSNRGLPWRGRGPSKTTGISYVEETPPTDSPERRSTEPWLASNPRIEERELEAGRLN